MALVGKGNEPITEVGLFAFDGTYYIPVLADTSGNLYVALKTDQNIQSRQYGYFGGDWRKQNLLLGYAGVVSEDKTNTDLPAGSSEMDGTAVPADMVYVITAAAIRYDGTSPTYIRIGCKVAGVSVYLVDQPSPTSGRWYGGLGQMVLSPGDYVLGFVVGATLHDDLYIRYLGYKFYTNL